MIDLVVLDIAGTTVQEHGLVYRALADTVTAAGGSADDVGRWMGADKREAISSMLGRSDVDAEFAGFHERLAKLYAESPPTPLPGVPEALAHLRSTGVKVALTTGFDRPIVDGLLDVLGWRTGVLDAVVCVDDVPAGRPAPYMIFKAMELTGARDVRRVLTAGDTVRDLEAGTNAGAGFVVGVLSGSQTAEELGRTRHTHLLPGVADLPALVA
ncbi:phosphonatase-like hydrolase [Lentzea flava]|uniref:Phosphonoacetaldehyde hydrolase n=1 Tax=Lentzea flava TaxID=103732 RepID=A0ABQ2UNZ4_9PSEU|nr:phosphonatase-like hydrolase [Lentzea flava]MCP2200137.1 phosphonatase-like hydrolase [Lentzea flava]GGU46326.1 phosphonoacetaldehyde hydrolase [Lentzea flava]